MQNLTLIEIEMLAGLLQRTGVNVYEMTFANSILDRLRAIAAQDILEQQAKGMPEQKESINVKAD